MRIAALGDSHLGRSAFPATTPEGVNQREQDFETSFERAVDLCLAQRPDLFVWLGDVFDHPRPSYRSFRSAMRALTKIREHGVGLVAISGNHDTPRLPGTGNPYAVLDDAFPEFHFAYRMGYEYVDLAGLRVHCVPQGRTSESTVESLHEAGANRKADVTNLLLTHPLVHGIERRYADINEIEVDRDDLRADLVLLGHYHFHLAVKEGVWYAGSTDTFSFADDPGREKGVVVLDTDRGVCRHVALHGQRPLCSPDPVYAFGRSVLEIQNEVCEKLGELPEGAVARLVLDGISPEAYRLLDLSTMQDAGPNLLNVKLDPRFADAVHAVEDLPELASMGARWRAYVGEQMLDGVDPERVAASGHEYLEAAIESATESAAD